MAGNAASETSGAAPEAAKVSAASQVSLLGLDRRAMEAGRLARRQRQLEQAKPGEAKEAKTQPVKAEPIKAEPVNIEPVKTELKRKVKQEVVVLDDSDDDVVALEEPPARKRKLETTNRVARSASFASRAGSGTALPYPDGVVKRTWMRGQPRTADDVTIEEVLQKDKLQMAIISSFQWDDEWMLKLIDVRRTKLLLIAYAADEVQKKIMSANVPNSNVRFCFPYVTSMTNMHSKLQLLKYDGYLRVVVPTGNLAPYDWGETATIENMVFMIDLPRLPVGSDRKATRTPFQDDLSYFLTAQDVDDSLVESLSNYDFSKTARYAFVHTICGSHINDSWQRTGYCGLGRAVKMLGWANDSPIQIDYLCSSIGSVGDAILNALYYACQGDSGLKEYEARSNKPKRAKTGPDWLDKFRVYFPSSQTVAESRGGPRGARTICFQRDWWQALKFPKDILRDYQNVRPGILTHSKVLFVRPTVAGKKEWAYLGSANFSESAWGKLVKEKTTKELKLTCRNWECGVLVPAVANSASRAPEDPAMLDSFKGVVPMPMVLPGSAYHGKQGAAGTPWFFREM